jgi:hypothetical protein
VLLSDAGDRRSRRCWWRVVAANVATPELRLFTYGLTLFFIFTSRAILHAITQPRFLCHTTVQQLHVSKSASNINSKW